jgi:hypothetical protein
MPDDNRTLLWVFEFAVVVLLMIVLKMRIGRRKRNGIVDLFGLPGIALSVVFFLVQGSKLLVWSLR